MARQYSETMALAQVNRYLWRNAAPPVDVGDLDIAGIAALLVRAFGSDVVLREMASLDVERLVVLEAPSVPTKRNSTASSR